MGMKLGVSDLITMPELAASVHSTCILWGRGVNIGGQRHSHMNSRHCSCSYLSSEQSLNLKAPLSRAGRAQKARAHWHQKNGLWKERCGLSQPVGLDLEAVLHFHLGSRSVEQENKQQAHSCGPDGVGSNWGRKDSWARRRMHRSNSANRSPPLAVGPDFCGPAGRLSALAQGQAGPSPQGQTPLAVVRPSRE